MESLGKIFGSRHRVKIMRLFLFNVQSAFDIDDITDKTHTKRVDARAELNMLTKIGFLRKKTFTKKNSGRVTKSNPKPPMKRLKKDGWVLDRKFDLAEPLRVLLLESELINEKDLIKKIKKSGKISLLALSGIFTRDENRKLDMLIVGDKIAKDVLDKEIRVIESEIGRELRYSVFTKEEFEYRISMYDKLIRDVIENEHIRLVNNIMK